jgi:ParB family transcriptional regulator, chromosome partitioning protein
LAHLFARLLKLPEDDVLRVMALAMAETMTCGTATAEAVAMTTRATLNDWRPDDAFFDLLGGKDVVQAMLADIASPAVADGNRNETSKVQKGIVKDFLHGANGREHKMDWLPPYFQFPPKAYTERAGVCAVDKWSTAASRFTA